MHSRSLKEIFANAVEKQLITNIRCVHMKNIAVTQDHAAFLEVNGVHPFWRLSLVSMRHWYHYLRSAKMTVQHWPKDLPTLLCLQSVTPMTLVWKISMPTKHMLKSVTIKIKTWPISFKHSVLLMLVKPVIHHFNQRLPTNNASTTYILRGKPSNVGVEWIKKITCSIEHWPIKEFV